VHSRVNSHNALLNFFQICALSRLACHIDLSSISLSSRSLYFTHAHTPLSLAISLVYWFYFTHYLFSLSLSLVSWFYFTHTHTLSLSLFPCFLRSLVRSTSRSLARCRALRNRWQFSTASSMRVPMFCFEWLWRYSSRTRRLSLRPRAPLMCFCV
jgi:hypothetical protein